MNFIDFVTHSGKNIGTIQNTKLSIFLKITKRKILYLRNTNKMMFDCVYMGALCKANNITKADLIELLKQKNKE
jgi:hypothetical protein